MTVHLFTWFVLCVGDGGVYHERFTALVLQLNPPPSSLGEIVSLACVSHTYPVLFFFFRFISGTLFCPLLPCLCTHGISLPHPATWCPCRGLELWPLSGGGHLGYFSSFALESS